MKLSIFLYILAGFLLLDALYTDIPLSLSLLYIDSLFIELEDISSIPLRRFSSSPG
jgi:hypothetical protein